MKYLASISVVAVAAVVMFGAAPTDLEKVEKIMQNKIEQAKKGDPRLPKGYEVHVYSTPAGDGYQILWQDEEGMHSKGYGPEAESRTGFSPAVRSATST